jgi:hypothetical protein
MSTETIRSGFTIDGQRVFLEFDASRSTYRLATRWAWLAEFPTLADAADVFDALEFCEGDLRHAARIIKADAQRLPRHHMICATAMDRTWGLLKCLEHRQAGRRPVYCGSKGAVINWVAA